MSFEAFLLCVLLFLSYQRGSRRNGHFRDVQRVTLKSPALSEPYEVRCFLYDYYWNPDTLYLDQNQIDEWKRRGYDIDAWQRGERLAVNNKHPRSEFLSVVRRAVSALKQK